jgi:hypothetical protein
MPRMKLITALQMSELIANGVESAKTGDGSHFKPVVKLFTPDANATWLFAEIGADGDTLFGLCDLGMGMPELGYASLHEIMALRGKFGLPVERDMHFKAKGTMKQYAQLAREAGCIKEIDA